MKTRLEKMRINNLLLIFCYCSCLFLSESIEAKRIARSNHKHRSKRNFNYQHGGYDENEFNRIDSNSLSSPLSSASSYAYTNLDTMRPCPTMCNCNFDTINCNDLIDACPECVHWSKIDFNQISEMRPKSFKHYRFSSNHTTHIIIYKLMNSTLYAHTFDSMHLGSNAHVEITFQYNSMIKFGANSLKNLIIDSNASLVFNFPYTTQVLFMPKCFDGIQMRDSNSRLIIRILKSFSVRFVGDFGFYLRKQFNLTGAESSANSKRAVEWSLSTGKLIIDIKSTHLVKFDEYSFAHLNLVSSAHFYIDLELIEKLMLQGYSFSNLNLNSNAKLIFFAKQITFLDLKAHSLASMHLSDSSQAQIYLEELTSSLCLQRNVFSNMKLVGHSSFNFSVINSKNVQLMHHAFSNLRLENYATSFFVGVFHMPSYLLLHQNDMYYSYFLNERQKYLNMHNNLLNYFGSTDFFFNSRTLSGDNKISDMDMKTFHRTNKQLNLYNFSIERNSFQNFTSASSNANIFIVADNVHTFYLDNEIFSNSNIQTALSFILNVKHFVASNLFNAIAKRVNINFLKETRVLKFDSSQVAAKQERPMLIKLNGLGLMGDEQHSVKTVDYFNSESDEPYSPSIILTDFCLFKRLPKSDLRISVETSNDLVQHCSCQTIYLFYNQLREFESVSEVLKAKILPCKLSNLSFIQNCVSKLEQKCLNNEINSEEAGYHYVKFWDFCISEPDSPPKLPPNFRLSDLNERQMVDTDAANYIFELDNQFKSFDENHQDILMHHSSSSSSSSSTFLNNQNEANSFDSSDNESLNNSIYNSTNQLGKIVGIAVVSFVVCIILFMIIVNIIQYKFRNDLFDDFECSSQNITNSNALITNLKMSSNDIKIERLNKRKNNCDCEREYRNDESYQEREDYEDENDESSFSPVKVNGFCENTDQEKRVHKNYLIDEINSKKDSTADSHREKLEYFDEQCYEAKYYQNRRKVLAKNYRKEFDSGNSSGFISRSNSISTIENIKT